MLRVSNYYQSKALIIKNNFQCNNTHENCFLWTQTTGNSILVFSKILFWRSFLGSNFLPFLRCLISEKICVFSFSQNQPERDPQMYIFFERRDQNLSKTVSIMSIRLFWTILQPLGSLLSFSGIE